MASSNKRIRKLVGIRKDIAKAIRGKKKKTNAAQSKEAIPAIKKELQRRELQTQRRTEGYFKGGILR